MKHLLTGLIVKTPIGLATVFEVDEEYEEVFVKVGDAIHHFNLTIYFGQI